MIHFAKFTESRLKNYEAVRVAATILVETLEKHLPHDELYFFDGEEQGPRYSYDRLLVSIRELLDLTLHTDHCSSNTCAVE